MVALEAGMMKPQVKEFWKPLEAEEARKGFFSRASGGSGAMPTPSFWPSGQQNCERLKVCHFKTYVW